GNTADLNISAQVIGAGANSINGLIKMGDGVMALTGATGNPALVGQLTIDAGTLLLGMTAPVNAFGGALAVYAPGTSVKMTTNNAAQLGSLTSPGAIFLNNNAVMDI